MTDVGIDGKDSAALAMYDQTGHLTPVGKVTAAIHEASVGDVVEVKYLYVNDLGAPRLYQPVLLRRRTDKRACDCTLDQLEGTVANRTVLQLT